MGKPTSTPAARVERYRQHIATRYTPLDQDTERAELIDILQSNALEAIESGDAVEAQTWGVIGQLRYALRERAWR